MVDGFQTYPSEQRQGQHYAIRYIKSLLALGHVREVGPTGFALLSLIAAYEDRFMYTRAIGFREKQLADELGITRQTLRTVRAKLVKLGLLAFKPGARNRDGRYYTTGVTINSVQNLDTIQPLSNHYLTTIQPESNHYLTNTRPTPTPTPTTSTKRESARKFSPPTLDEVSSFWKRNKLNGDPELFFHHYNANDWTQGGKARLFNWESAAKKWSLKENTFESKDNQQAKPKFNQYGKELI